MSEKLALTCELEIIVDGVKVFITAIVPEPFLDIVGFPLPLQDICGIVSPNRKETDAVEDQR